MLYKDHYSLQLHDFPRGYYISSSENPLSQSKKLLHREVLFKQLEIILCTKYHISRQQFQVLYHAYLSV